MGLEKLGKEVKGGKKERSKDIIIFCIINYIILLYIICKHIIMYAYVYITGRDQNICTCMKAS